MYHNVLHFHSIPSVFPYHAPERHSKLLVLTGYAAYGFHKASMGFTELQLQNRPVCTYSFSKFWHAAARNSMWAPNSIKSSISRLLNKHKEKDIISDDRKPLNKDYEDGVSFNPSFLLYKTLSLLSDWYLLKACPIYYAFVYVLVWIWLNCFCPNSSLYPFSWYDSLANLPVLPLWRNQMNIYAHRSARFFFITSTNQIQSHCQLQR